jgi:CRISPR/Cas system-associated exonuclease Cas4 (RecB family)
MRNNGDDRTHISASQIHTWMYCQRSFHFKYNLGLPQASSAAMNRGKLFHERVAKALVAKEEPFLPRKWLQNYRAIVDRLSFTDDLLVEQKVETDVDGHNVLGYVDVIDRGQRLIVDWKFGRKVGKYDVQGYLYKRLVKEIYGLDCDVAFAFVPALAIKPMYPADYEDGQAMFEAFLDKPPECVFKFYATSRKCQMCGYFMYCMNPQAIEGIELED